MEQDSLRALSTLLLFIAFIGLCIRVYSRKNKTYYEEAAKLPFVDDIDDIDAKKNPDSGQVAARDAQLQHKAANRAGESDE